jgi:S1-C subfamily serine protease
MRRENAQTDFVEPLRMFKTVEVGEQVFVIGHPEGLEFSLSGGLVAQKRGKDLIQMSAPVSPGNSGGPVYDSHGRLIAIVQSVIDKSKSPNAENLNFAVRADDLLIEDSWNLLKEGNYAIKLLVEAAKTDIDK